MDVVLNALKTMEMSVDEHDVRILREYPCMVLHTGSKSDAETEIWAGQVRKLQGVKTVLTTNEKIEKTELFYHKHSMVPLHGVNVFKQLEAATGLKCRGNRFESFKDHFGLQPGRSSPIEFDLVNVPRRLQPDG